MDPIFWGAENGQHFPLFYTKNHPENLKQTAERIPRTKFYLHAKNGPNFPFLKQNLNNRMDPIFGGAENGQHFPLFYTKNHPENPLPRTPRAKFFCMRIFFACEKWAEFPVFETKIGTIEWTQFFGGRKTGSISPCFIQKITPKILSRQLRGFRGQNFFECEKWAEFRVFETKI